MSDDLKVAGIVSIFVILFLGILFWSGQAINAWKCANRWEDSGMEYQYSWGGGCRVKTPDGVWIPAENFREI